MGGTYHGRERSSGGHPGQQPAPTAPRVSEGASRRSSPCKRLRTWWDRGGPRRWDLSLPHGCCEHLQKAPYSLESGRSVIGSPQPCFSPSPLTRHPNDHVSRVCEAEPPGFLLPARPSHVPLLLPLDTAGQRVGPAPLGKVTADPLKDCPLSFLPGSRAEVNHGGESRGCAPGLGDRLRQDREGQRLLSPRCHCSSGDSGLEDQPGAQEASVSPPRPT